MEHWPSVNCEWRENDTFLATMQLQEGVSSGRSAKYVWWKNVDTGALYPMFVTDIVDLVLRSTLHNGEVTTFWRAQKRGQNYGLRRAYADEV
jgi:hypothetical protein